MPDSELEQLAEDAKTWNAKGVKYADSPEEKVVEKANCEGKKTQAPAPIPTQAPAPTGAAASKEGLGWSNKM